MSVTIGMTTYNRRDMCQSVVDKLKDQADEIIVLRDGGESYDIEGATNYAKKNGGKEGYINTFQMLIDKVAKTESDYAIFVPDDVDLERDFVDRAVELFEGCPHDVVVLNILKDGRGRSFGSITPVQLDAEYWHNDWVDGCFICYTHSLKGMKLKQRSKEWFKEYKSGSGLGHSLSKAFRSKGEIWQVSKSLVNHLGHESMMNPEERKVNPLVSHFYPKVSIIIPYVKDRGYLDEAIESAKAQDYEGEVEIVLSGSDNRVGYNINKALETATGHYWKYLCDDDTLPDNSVSKLTEIMNTGMDFVHSNALRFGSKKGVHKPSLKTFTASQLARKNYIHGGTTMYRTDTTLKVGGWDEEVWTAEELEFHMRLLANGAKLGYLDAVTYNYRVHGQQKSNDRSAKRVQYIKALREKYR